MVYSEVKKHMNNAYELMRQLEVSQDNVKRVALAEQEMEDAFRALKKIEAAKAETPDTDDTAAAAPDREVTENGC